ncbi:MAG: hypothetical protein IPL35_06465 [Sphingobacteriales bacterium]|nr:hypothetical protein [Sphingobacteriales bacterium]
MKKLFFGLPLMFVAFAANAQWTDAGTAMTTTDNISVGTATSLANIYSYGSSEFELALDAAAGNPDFTFMVGGNTKAQVRYLLASQGIGFEVDAAHTGATGLPGNPKLYVNGSGVCVNGTALATGYVLSVRGKAIAEEVRVQLQASWPDYVFANDYDLMPLSELEASIKTNKHLPGIPTASEVDANGFDLGEMNRLQMEKIEELTLYIIGLQKQIDALKAK